MHHLPTLITDLAVITIYAGLVTLLFKWLKQPVVLGYVLAGIFAGPFIHGLPSVTDKENIQIWADIGVIFLLFSTSAIFFFSKLPLPPRAFSGFLCSFSLRRNIKYLYLRTDCTGLTLRFILP